MAKKHRAMSMEAAMEEDRLEIVSMLEKTKALPRNQKGHLTLQPDSDNDVSPSRMGRSRVRGGTLDIDDDKLSPYSAPAPSASSFNRPMRSMLEVENLPQGLARSAQTSPVESNNARTFNNGGHHRSQSDASSHPANLIPRPHGDKVKGDVKSTYNFSDYKQSTTTTLKAPKRSSSQKRGSQGSMADAIRGELSGYGVGRKSMRHSIAGTSLAGLPSRSKSPIQKVDRRAFSPGPSILKKVHPLNDGALLDKNTAYVQLSEKAPVKPSADPQTAQKKGRGRANSEAEDVSPGSKQQEKEFFEGEHAVCDSSDEDASRSSDEEASRGRRKGSHGEDADTERSPSAEGTGRLPVLPLGSGEARESSQHIKSMLEPEITITGPGGDRLKNSKPGVHPMNAFDQAEEGQNATVDSDTEADISDIKRAQKLAVIMTPVVSTPATKRCVRTIYRGDFAKMQREAEDNSRRVRKYLVATDLSEEAAHALEWTVGTVLRDGDTLLCIYCVDEDVGIGEATEGSDGGLPQQAESLAAIANSPLPLPTPGSPKVKAAGVGPGAGSGPGPSPLGGELSRSGSPTPSPMGRGGFRAEAERFRAVEDITTRVSRLLRKTRLQVRVVVEVIHCKSPRHLLTEVIDYLAPTLVILGSRGRSALKGVILGSFSNYLVTKSSVPVMVARKKLRKHTKYKRPAIKLANNLTNNSRSLAAAKID